MNCLWNAAAGQPMLHNFSLYDFTVTFTLTELEPQLSPKTVENALLKLSLSLSWSCNCPKEITVENAQWRKVQQMQPMHWLLAATTKPTFLNPDYLQIVYTATHKRLKLGNAK